jgi:hypothetical protein
MCQHRQLALPGSAVQLSLVSQCHGCATVSTCSVVYIPLVAHSAGGHAALAVSVPLARTQLRTVTTWAARISLCQKLRV